MPRILILDIETSPHMALVWKFWKENISPKQVLKNGQILSFAAKWLEGEKIYYEDVSKQDEKSMLHTLFDLLDQADIVVCHNGDKFDLPHIQGRGLVLGLRPPSPYKTIDTLKVAKWEFNFPSNSLEYLSNVLELVLRKGGHKKFPGFELWLGVLANNPEAWAEMKEYNIQDIMVLEELYLKFRPWMRRHPNVAVYEEVDKTLCPKCGSAHIQWRGYAVTNVYKYKKFQCQSCFGWGRTRFNILPKEFKHALAVNAG